MTDNARSLDELKDVMQDADAPVATAETVARRLIPEPV